MSVKNDINGLKFRTSNMFFLMMILMLGLILVSLILNQKIYRLEHPVTNNSLPTTSFITSDGKLISGVSVERALLSDGWSLNCVQSVNVSKHKYVEEYKTYCGGANIFARVCMTTSDSNCKIYCPDGSEADPNNPTVVPAHVVYYNESVCVKESFVKDLRVEFVGGD